MEAADKAVIMDPIDNRAMRAFFQKHPAELDYSVAVSMIDKKVDHAVKKCKDGDESYINDLAKAYEMIDDFFNELEVNPASLV